MGDYQVTNYGLCGECKWHKYLCIRSRLFDGFTVEEWYCDNMYSNKAGQITAYTDNCPLWAGEVKDEQDSTKPRRNIHDD